ncbi:hypothetical protein ACQRXC_29205 (plasmid) [Niallia taxi]|uniref:hypothetical protein n=1 Tax=Niallia taxi TaxID=2499688 RepID=UPI003F612182
MFRELEEQVNNYANKLGNGSEIAIGFNKAVFYVLLLFTCIMNCGPCEKGIKQIVLRCFGSENLSIYGLGTLDYGLSLYIYFYSIGLSLILITYLLSKKEA